MKHFISCTLLCLVTSLSAQNNRQIQEAMVNFDYETALSLIEHEKPTPTLLLQKGRAQKGLSMNSEALITFRQLIIEEPTNSQIYVEAAECCKALAKYKGALTYYQMALDLNPKSKYVRLQYINLLCIENQFQEAFGESSLMAENDSSLAVLHLQAQSLEGMKNHLAAAGCYHVIQDKYPSDYLAAAKLGNIYCAMGEYKYAIEATEKYCEIDSTNIVVNRQNAFAYCLNQEYPTAIKRYESLFSQGDSTLLNTYYLGISYYAVENFVEAKKMLDIVFVSSPEDANLLYYLGRVCSRTLWKEEGIDYMKQAINLTIPSDSTMTRLYRGLVDCYRLGNKPKEQIETIRELYKYDKANHRLLYDIATVYHFNLRDKKNAERTLETYLKTEPKESKADPSGLNAKGELELGANNYYNAARSMLEDIRKEQKKEEFFNGAAQSKK